MQMELQAEVQVKLGRSRGQMRYVVRGLVHVVLASLILWRTGEMEERRDGRGNERSLLTLLFFVA